MFLKSRKHFSISFEAFAAIFSLPANAEVPSQSRIFEFNVSASYNKMTITFDALDRFQGNKFFRQHRQ